MKKILSGLHLLQDALCLFDHHLAWLFLLAALIERLELRGEVIKVNGDGLVLHKLNTLHTDLVVLFNHFFSWSLAFTLSDSTLGLHFVDAAFLVRLIFLHQDEHLKADRRVILRLNLPLGQEWHESVFLNRLEAQLAEQVLLACACNSDKGLQNFLCWPVTKENFVVGLLVQVFVEDEHALVHSVEHVCLRLIRHS